jgi:hypothetical protein
MPAECLDWSQHMVSVGPHRRRRACRRSISPNTVVAFIEFRMIFEPGAVEESLERSMRLLGMQHWDKQYPITTWCALFRNAQRLIAKGIV